MFNVIFPGLGMQKREFLRLLKEDEEFRHAVAGLIGYEELLEGQREIREEIRKLWEEVRSLREESISLRKGQEKLWEEVRSLRESQEKLWEEVKSLRVGQEKLWEKYEQLAKGQEKLWEEVRSLREDFRSMNRKLDALGARWGIMSESAFRETLRGVVEKGFQAEVERWTHYDEEGYVFGYPSVIEIDILVRNGRCMAIEITSHARASDVAALKRKVELYERVTGNKVDEVVISSPFIDESALAAARKLGVSTHSGS